MLTFSTGRQVVEIWSSVKLTANLAMKDDHIVKVEDENGRATCVVIHTCTYGPTNPWEGRFFVFRAQCGGKDQVL